ncbi:MAG TPA: hypothetical protein VF469_28600 [Kofleriaceae bacterium]
MKVDPLPGQVPDGAPQGWPRTHGWDVLAIAAVVDPVVRTLPMEPGSFGIERRWRYCATDIADLALDRPNEEYPQNRAFWATLAATLAYLASIDAPVPHDLWRALLAEMASPGEWRDLDSDDYLSLSADSYEELWQAQKAALSQLRGVDVRESSSDTSDLRMIPRTTHRDVLQLANFWTLALIKAERKRPALGPDALDTLGLDGVRRRWNAVLADVDAHAMSGDPRDVYPRNHEFWSATAAVSVAITVIDTLPLGLHLAVARGMAERRNAGAHEIREATFDKTWTAQRDQLVKARGSDLREPLPGADGQAMQVPRTTNADILQLAAYWRSAWTKLEDAGKHGDVLSSASPVSLVDERTRWRAAMADVDKIARAGNPGDIYPKNDEFWRASRSLATTLGVFQQQPTPSQLLIDTPEDAEKSLPERLLELAKELPGQIADAAGAVAHAVNDIGREAGAGFFGGLGVPLLVGAGGLVVLWLLLRRNDPCEAE